jgi:hypothetical protein
MNGLQSGLTLEACLRQLYLATIRKCYQDEADLANTGTLYQFYSKLVRCPCIFLGKGRSGVFAQRS